MFNLKLTADEFNQLVGFVDLGVRQAGLNAVTPALLALKQKLAQAQEELQSGTEKPASPSL